MCPSSEALGKPSFHGPLCRVHSVVQSATLPVWQVTDDVSIIEALGKPVKITSGAYTNIKVGWWGRGWSCI